MLKTLLIFILSYSAWSLDQSTIDYIQQVIDIQTHHKSTAGIVVGIVHNGNRTILRSGMANLEANIPMTGEEFFEIGSVTKTFTSLLLSKAVIENKAQLHHTVDMFLPELKGSKAGEITLKQLSTHTSGIQRDTGMFPGNHFLMPYENSTRQFIIHEARYAKFTPITDREQYSNLGVAILGLCLEVIFQMPFQEVLYTHILSTLNLQDMNLIATEQVLAQMPMKYSDGLLPYPYWKNLGYMNSAGNLKATASQMLEYLYFQLHPEITPLAQVIQNSQMALQDFDRYQVAYGWFSWKINENEVYWHNGSTIGFTTDAYFSPKKDLGLIVLTNARYSTQCVYKIIFEDDVNCTLSIPLSDSKETLSELDGMYFHPSSKTILYISASPHGFLNLRVHGQESSVRLYKNPQGNYQFFGDVGHIQFIRSEQGKVTGLDFRQGSIEYTCSKF